MGDFNEVLLQKEMRGKRVRDRGQIMRFKDMLQDCVLKDIDLVNDQFTYSNRRKRGEETKSRIDRALVNQTWLRRWPKTVLKCCFTNSSDHKPIKLCLNGNRQKRLPTQMGLRQRSFRFEPMWLRETEFKEVVAEVWQETTQMRLNLRKRLHRCSFKMEEWNEMKFGKLHKKLSQ